MRRKRTPNTRLANTAEKKYIDWVKQQPCCFCGNDAPCIFDHVEGATYKHLKTLIGHWFGVGKCYECDKIKTDGGFAAHARHFEKTHSEAWQLQSMQYWAATGEAPPEDVIYAIKDYRR